MEALDPWATADALGETLRVLGMSGAFYCRSELPATIHIQATARRSLTGCRAPSR